MQYIFQKIGNQALAALILLLGATTLQSQSFSIGNLPAGKTIIVTYEVDVNANACPTGVSPVANISNQSNVSGTNFSTVQTHETTPGSPDPTLTPFGGLTLGNLVYKDVNKDGDYDAGTDTPVDGVNLRLYLDDGDGVLDAGDGTHIATATTTGGGLYSFNVCPGNYIVEVIPSNFNSGGALYDNALMAGLLSSPLTPAPDPDNNVDNDDNGDAINSFGVASKAITMAYGAEPDGTDLNTNNTLDFGFKTPTTVSIGNVTLAEGTGAGPTAFNFTVTRSDTDQDFNLTVNTTGGTATSGTDFTAISGGTVSFTGTNTMAPVTVNVTHDNIVEANETFTVNLSGAPSGVIITDGTGDGSINNDDNATLTLAITGGGASQDEGNTFTFTATLNNPVQDGFQVAYTTNNGGTNPATAGSDYTDNDGNLTFMGNAAEPQSWTVNTSNNNTVELDETISAVLGSISMTSAVQAAAISINGSPQTATLLNDDDATVSIVGDVLQSEILTPMNFSLQLSNPVDVNVTVQFSTTAGTATAGSDYTTITNQTVTFNANTTTTQVVGVTIAPDNIVEESESLTASIATLNASGRNVSIGASSRTGTINNDDNATVTLSPVGGVFQNEGNSIVTNFQFTATVDNPVQGGFMLGYSTMDGTATSPSDYTGGSNTLSFNGTAGQAINISIDVNGDLDIENNETFTVQLDAVSGTSAVQASAISIAGSPKTGTILNDEKDWGDAPTAAQSGFANSYPTTAAQTGANHTLVPGGLRLGATVDADLDGQPTATATGDGADEDGVTLPSAFAVNTTTNITVNASGAGRLNAWVDWNRNGSWADAGEKVLSDQLVAAGNNTLNISVPAGASLGTSFARFRLTTATGINITGSAADGEVEDYQVSVVSNAYSISSPTVTEGSAPNTVVLNFVVSRLDFTNAGSVDYSAPTGTATAGTDYVTIPAGTIHFTAGDNQPATVSITVNGDAIVEDNETVVINLSNPVNGGIGAGTGTGMITNDDLATLTLTGGTIQNEGNIGTVGFTFTATLNKAVQDGFKVAYTTTDGTATAGVDFTDNDGNLTFAGTIGETQYWTVDVNGDNTVELGETFEGALGAITMTSAVQTAAISVSGSPKTDIILNDDAATVSIAANVSQSENLTPQAFSVTLSNPVDVDVTVQFNTANNTATTGDNDYTGVVNQTVTFNAGTTTAQTVNVMVSNDSKVEANEIFDVGIGTLEASGRNVSLGTTARTGTIQNDDNATVTLTPVGGVNLPEGNTSPTNFVFTATLDNPVQGGFTLAYTTSDGTATTADNDYVDNDATLTFSDNSTAPQNITVQVNNDNKVEADETFTVALGAFSNTALSASLSTSGSPKTGTINNDEVDWGDAPDPLYTTLNANNGARHKTVLGVSLGAGIDGEADGQPTANADGDGADDDGVTLPSALVINTTANITVNASTGGLLNAWVDFNQNGTWESPSEQIFTNTSLSAGNNALTFSVPAGATLGTSYARFRFGNSNLAPTGLDNIGEVEDYQINIVNTQFSIDNPMVAEGNSPNTTNLTFRISRNVNANACSVQYTVTNGTATTADNDYTAGGIGTAVFSAGGALFQDITIIAVNGDNKVELDETVIMTLSNPVNASIASGMGTGTGTITNDDQGVITIISPTVTEGDMGTTNATFSISLSNPSDDNISFNVLGVTNTAMSGSDFMGTAGTGSMTAGSMTGSFSVPVNGDCDIEPNETFFGRLSALNANGRNIIFNGGGSTLDGTATITNDDALPVITCGGNASQNAATGTCAANVTLAPPSTSSLCGASTLEFRYRPLNNANVPTGAFSGYIPATSNTQSLPVGRHEVEWRVTDGSGSNTCNLYVDVIDNQPPTITCPGSITRNTDFGLCTAIVTYGPPTANDNCPGVVATLTSGSGTASGATFQKGNTTVVWQATDGAGLTATCTFVIAVVDNQNPTITCPGNIVRSNDLNTCGANVTYPDPVATDNCPGVGRDLMSGQLSGTIFSVGTETVTWRATDDSGRTSTCSFTVTVNDTQQPNITCPPNMIRPTSANACTALVTYNNATATDNCTLPSGQPTWVSGGTGTVQGPSTTTATFPKGTTTVQWRATDGAGFTKTCTFRVIVNDTQAPILTCPAPINLNTAPGVCTAVTTYSNPTYTDNCTPTSGTAVRISGPPSGSAFPVGTSNVVFQATDAAGLTRRCTMTVTVTDNQPPTINCPANVVATGSGTPCTAIIFYSTPTASDNCAGTLSPFLLSGLGSGSTYPAGVTTNTWRAITPTGETADCSFTVTVNCPLLRNTTSNQRTARAPLDWALSPNPARSEVVISLLSGTSAGQVDIFDALGRSVWQRAFDAGQYQLIVKDVATWPSGLYIVTLRTDDGQVAAKQLTVFD